jgi:hypothetical protein
MKKYPPALKGAYRISAMGIMFYASTAGAAQSCSNSGSVWSCVVPAGSYSAGIDLLPPLGGASSGQAFTVLSSGTFVVPASQYYALRVQSGNVAGVTTSEPGFSNQGLTINNTGSLTLQGAPGLQVNGPVYGVFATMSAGDGANASGDDAAGSGGNASQVLTLTNSGAITLGAASGAPTPGASGVQGGAALYGFAGGGNGGQGEKGPGGTGGQSAGVSIINSGVISTQLTGAGTFAGIWAQSQGGSGNGAEGGHNYGGGGGIVSVSNSAALNVDWTWGGQTGSTDAVFGILAESAGGTGGTATEDGNGGAGGFTDTPMSASVALTSGGNVTLTQSGTPPSAGAGVAAIITGGNGGNAMSDNDGVLGGAGGAAGAIVPGAAASAAAVKITVNDASVITSGDKLPALLISAQGGAGGGQFYDGSYSDRNGGNGGQAGDGSVLVTTSRTGIALSTNGQNAAGVQTLQQGGAGGDGAQYNGDFIGIGFSNAGNGGNGGAAGQLNVNLTGQPTLPISVTTKGDNSPGIYALLQGGQAGDGGQLNGNIGGGSGGSGGAGGGTGNMSVSLAATQIATQGVNAYGIVAQNKGAAGGAGGQGHQSDALGSPGGAGGSSGYVHVSLDANSSITTHGANAGGILAQTASGAGGNGGPGYGELASTGGTGGSGGTSGPITVSNAGSITTFGASAVGILAQSVAGSGGAGSDGYGIFYSGAGTGGSSGSVGSVTINQSGTISTAGNLAHGILAQSIGGSGGAGGNAGGLIVALGGSTASNPFQSNANQVTINATSGSITTTGTSALGVLAQSIGGGGGDGGSSNSAVSIGASGGLGGDGSTVKGTLASTNITTQGDNAHAFVAQSIGGGGGNAGNADGIGLFASVALGGSGGNGGIGGTLVANLSNTTIIASGSKAAGLVAQSIGGGGGTGGQAMTGAIGVGFSASVGIGGSGGKGGDGGEVTSQMTGGMIATGQNNQLVSGSASCAVQSCLAANELPVDAFGVVVQSIGGGGGLGGSASAKAVAISIPVTPSGSQVAMSAGVALGGSGGVAGDGQAVTFGAGQGAQIITSGQGAHAVMIQSIGGGGGSGGDSSALAAALGYGKSVPEGAASISITPTFSVGGNGGAAGDGGPVWVALGGSVNGTTSFVPDAVGSTPSTITTYGDYANGINAQSIGGGGGNAGFGSGNTQSFGSGNDISVNITLGSDGAAGGNGGLVQAAVLPTGAITTYGSGAIGLLAQSIGGGGGTSQGGSYNVIGATSKVGANVTVKVGTTGGKGGAGGEVVVNVDGHISTAGGDAPGVEAQSIGGGGGQGGSAGSDASLDNPILATIKGRATASNLYKAITDDNPSVSVNVGLSVSVGGGGGSANTGGPVTVNLGAGGGIVTKGDWSTGIFAQSVGGGGGKGGAALATGGESIDPLHWRVNSDVAVGGSGGSGANGGAVTANLSGGTISTAGFGAAGVLAQSVGGGGGHGADGSDGFLGSLSLGLAFAGSGSAGGSSGAVTLNTQGTNSITTTGEGGFGAVLQSVGGSGGFAGAGSSIRFSGLDAPVPPIQLTVGGDETNANHGSGSTVLFQDQGTTTITTSGNNAYGILAQSVGGGGGILANSQNQFAISGGIKTSIYGTAQQAAGDSDGGAVTVNLGSNSKISTSGTGAHGILAQSVGGGGGIVGLPNTGAVLTLDATKVGTLKGGNGGGGNVAVTNAGAVEANGPGAVGILAQSVGGAGGLQLGTDGNSVYAGSATHGKINDATVTVNVTNSGFVSATGAGGIGIFAQNTNGAGVSMTIDGNVVGGSQGIWIDSVTGSTLTVGSTGQVTSVTENAIYATSSPLNVTNEGNIIGTVALNSGTMNNHGAVYGGAEFEGNLVNNGLVALGGRDGTLPGNARTKFAPTTIDGSFTQTASGTLQVGADFNTRQNDTLQINGPAVLDGKLKVAPRALLPGRELAVLNVNGPSTGALTAVDSPVFNYETRQSGQDTLVRVAGANFTADSMQLKANQKAVAEHLQRSWDLGGSSALAPLYAGLDTASGAGAGEYRQRVSDLSPGVALAPAAQMQFGMARFTGAMMSCPAFKGADSLTKEQNCFWGEVTARRTEQDANRGTSGYSSNSETYQFGGQRQIAPNWYLGGSMAYQNTRLRGDDHRVSGTGDSGYAGIVLKREAGPWTFSGALGGGYGSYDLDRNMSVAGYDNTAKSTPDVYSFGARLRAARTFTQGNFYLKPYVDLDATQSRMPGYTESGSDLRLKVHGSDQFVMGLAPTLEVGGRVDLPKGAMLRPFAYAGMSFLSQDGWKTKASLDGAPAGTGSFDTSMPTDNVIGRIGAGVQVLNAAGLDFRLQYDGEFASKGTSHAGSLKVTMPF